MGKKRRQQMPNKDCVKESSTMEDWISNLARTAAESSVSKKERIEKRQAKKRRRQEQHRGTITTRTEHAVSQNAFHRKEEHDTNSHIIDRKSVKSSKKQLKRLAAVLRECVQEARSNNKRPYYTDSKKVAVVKHKKKRWDPDSIQPRHCDYGGIGLARPSLFLALDDPAFFPRLEQEFQEHIPGFFGRTKAMKNNGNRQRHSKMLWRQLQETKNSKLMGKRLSDMSPDERVEAMLQAGML